MHQEFTTIQQLIDYAQKTPGSLGKGLYTAGSVSEELAREIAQVSGLQVVGYRITIDHSAIIHTLRQHGQAMEVLRGQIIITETDVLDLVEWLPSPTQVADAGQAKGRLQCLRFLKITPSVQLTAIMEVRTRKDRQQLALKTLYKKRSAA